MKITGKTLIDLGFKSGKWFKGAIAYVNENKLKGEALITYLDSVAPQTIDPFETGKAYQKNIEAETAEETNNIERVFQTMDELMKTPTVVNGAVMPDACPTGKIGQIPVGGVVVTKDAIHPAMHSADVCCSVMMTSFGKVDPKKVLDAAFGITHFGGGGRADVFDFPNFSLKSLKSGSFSKSSAKRIISLSFFNRTE